MTFNPDPSGLAIHLGINEDFMTGDVDGDGRDDVMQIAPQTASQPVAHLQAWRSNGDGSFSRTIDQPVLWNTQQVEKSCDPLVSISLGPTFSISWNVYASCDYDLPVQYFVGDVNGDGKSDFMGVSHASNNTVVLHTALSMGNEMIVLPDSTTSWLWGDINTKKDRFFPADMNGDGKIDLVHIAFHPANVPGEVVWEHNSINIALSNGDGTFTPTTGQQNILLWDDEGQWFPGRR